MTAFFSALSAYQYHNLQDLIAFLALISTTSWILVLFTTLLRSAVRLTYKQKAKRVARSRS